MSRGRGANPAKWGAAIARDNAAPSGSIATVWAGCSVALRWWVSAGTPSFERVRGMNIAYLDPPYSCYFRALSAQLSARIGGRATALLSSPAYLPYTRGDRSLLWAPGAPCEHYGVPEAFARAAWNRSGEPAFDRVFSHAVEWFIERFRAEKIDLCLIFSDARPFSAAARVAAERLADEQRVVCLHFERGAYRLRSASLATEGLNARFDLTSAQAWDKVAGMTRAELPPRRSPEPWLRLRFVAFMARHALACALEPERGALQHKRYHPFNYLRIGVQQWLAAHPRWRPRADLSAAMPDQSPRLLLPLQLPTDSQFVMYSPFRHNQELLDFVASEAAATLPGLTLSVKRHPMDVRRYRLPSGAQWVDGALARHAASAVAVVCINSTAGYEAAVQGKPVLCFGPSFYTSHPRIWRVTRDSFGNGLREAVRSGDDALAGAALEADVLRHYQTPGDVWGYTPEDLERTADLVWRLWAADAKGASPSTSPGPSLPR